MIDWLNDNSGAVQAIAVAVLVLVTAVYAGLTWWVARATRRQADASVEMAREMREARHAGVLPVVDFVVEPPDSSEELGRVFRILAGHLPETQWGRLRNIGLGPALDVTFQIKLDDTEPSWRTVGHLGIGVAARTEDVALERWPFYLEPIGDSVKRLRVDYYDAYGRKYHSWRAITFDPAVGGWKIGPLRRRS